MCVAVNAPGTHCFQDTPSSCLMVTDSLSQRSCNMFNTVIFVPSTFIHFNIPQPIPPYVIIKVRLHKRRATAGQAMRCLCPCSLGACSRLQKKSYPCTSRTWHLSGGNRPSSVFPFPQTFHIQGISISVFACKDAHPSHTRCWSE